MRVLAMATIALAIGAALPKVALAAILNGGAARILASAGEQPERVQYRGTRHRQHGTTTRQQISRDRSSQWNHGWRHRRDTVRMLDEQRNIAIRRARNADRASRAWQRYLDD